MMRKLLVIGTALWAISLTGCDLYYGTPNDGRCDVWTCDDQPDENFRPGPVEPGGECRTNDACAAGCYCDDVEGICIETGFCNFESDCPAEFTCDERATCIPLDDDDGCDREDGDDCCDEEDGDCNDPPPPPPPPTDCQDDSDCLPGCICDDNDMCQETGFCDSSEDCMDIANEDGTFTPAECDPIRNTCVPRTPPVATCNETITCEVAAPTCAADQTPAIVEGCYTGECLNRSDCDVPPLALCENILNPSQCQGRLDCQITYDGYDCTCAGEVCDCGNPPLDEAGNPISCECATWEPRCESI